MKISSSGPSLHRVISRHSVVAGSKPCRTQVDLNRKLVVSPQGGAGCHRKEGISLRTLISSAGLPWASRIDTPHEHAPGVRRHVASGRRIG